jgi:hypothetical protein
MRMGVSTQTRIENFPTGVLKDISTSVWKKFHAILCHWAQNAIVYTVSPTMKWFSHIITPEVTVYTWQQLGIHCYAFHVTGKVPTYCQIGPSICCDKIKHNRFRENTQIRRRVNIKGKSNVYNNVTLLFPVHPTSKYIKKFTPCSFQFVRWPQLLKRCAGVAVVFLGAIRILDAR